MRTIRTAFIAITAFIAASLVLATFTPALAANRHKTSTDTLKVYVTDNSGQVWGTVTVKYKSGHKEKKLGSCSAAKCVMHPPHMVKLTLSESPKFPITWPFTGWKLDNGSSKAQTSKKSTLSFEISKGHASVWANYYPKG